MALQRLTINGYGQLELNQVAFRRDGRIEAQCKLDETDFAEIPAENGMLLTVDNINRTVKLYTEENAELPIALNYTTEKIYDERTPGLKNFASTLKSFLPRLGYLSVGDKFTTNTVCYDNGDFADDDALMEAVAGVAETKLYGQPCENGAIQITTEVPTTSVKLLVIKKTTMPDGQPAVKFQAV